MTSKETSVRALLIFWFLFKTQFTTVRIRHYPFQLYIYIEKFHLDLISFYFICKKHTRIATQEQRARDGRGQQGSRLICTYSCQDKAAYNWIQWIKHDNGTNVNKSTMQFIYCSLTEFRNGMNAAVTQDDRSRPEYFGVVLVSGHFLAKSGKICFLWHCRSSPHFITSSLTILTFMAPKSHSCNKSSDIFIAFSHLDSTVSLIGNAWRSRI